MEQYITVKKLDKGGVIVCTHPLVDKVWQFGSKAFGYIKPEDKEMELYTAILFKDGSRKQFLETDLSQEYPENDFKIANEYLNTIPHEKK